MKGNDFTTDSKKIIKICEELNLGNIKCDKNLDNFAKKFKIIFNLVQNKNINIEEIKPKENNVFLNNIDYNLEVSKDNFLLKIEIILQILYKNHFKILNSMLNLHKYSEDRKIRIFKFIEKIPTLRKNEIIEWMNKNGIDLQRSLYIYLISRRMPAEIYDIIEDNFSIYGEFTSLDIQNDIEMNLNKLYKLECTCDKIKMNLDLFSNKKIILIDEFIKRCFFFNFFSENKRDLKIKLWLSKLKKKIPLTRKDKYLGPKEINSGCTDSFEISLWRKEEMSKIVLHELMHYLDLENIKDLKVIREYFYKKYDIQRDITINFFESYTEIWANVMNICFCVFENINLNKKTKKKNNNIINEIVKLLNIELTFNLIQSAKILKFYGYKKFSDFYRKDGFNENEKSKKFNQRSNVFSYFLGRVFLFYNFDYFLSLCYTYNKENIVKNNIPISKFIDIVEKTVNDEKFRNIIDNLINNFPKSNFISRTLRFSAIESDII